MTDYTRKYAEDNRALLITCHYNNKSRQKLPEHE